jgi:hypothetical protein
MRGEPFEQEKGIVYTHIKKWNNYYYYDVGECSII